jgi:hypothetical protein
MHSKGNKPQSTDCEHQGTGTHGERGGGVLASGERRKMSVQTHLDLLPVLALPLELPNTQEEKAQNNHRNGQMSSWCVVHQIQKGNAAGRACMGMRREQRAGGVSTERQLCSNARA